jgi:hypothetical protein
MEFDKVQEYLEDPASLADDYIAKRDERLAADKVAKALKEEESALEAVLDRLFAEKNLTAVGGKSGTVTQQRNSKPICTDWDQLYKYIVQENAFELLHKRLTEGAAQDRISAGVEIPGVKLQDFTKFSISNRKKLSGKDS